MLASLVGCGDSQKNAGPDAQQIEHDKEIARLEQKWGRLAAEKELAEKTANAEAKRLAFERAKLEIEKESFEAEKKRLAANNAPATPPVPPAPVVRVENNPPAGLAADISKAEQERNKIEVEKLRTENDRATVEARNEAEDKGFNTQPPKLPVAVPGVTRVGPVPQPVPPFAGQPLPPQPNAKATPTPTPTPRPVDRSRGVSSKPREKGLRPVGLEPSSGL